MLIEKKCSLCKGSGELEVLSWPNIQCYECEGTGKIIEDFEYGDMRYDKFMDLVGEMLYRYSIGGYISDEAGDLIHDEIYRMVEDKGIISIDKYHQLKDGEES